MGVVLEESHIIGPIVSVPKAETSRTSLSASVGRENDYNSTRMFFGAARQEKELDHAVRRTVIIPESSRDQLFNRLGDSIVQPRAIGPLVSLPNTETSRTSSTMSSLGMSDFSYKGESREAGETMCTVKGDYSCVIDALSPIVAKESGLLSSAAKPFGRLRSTRSQANDVVLSQEGLTLRQGNHLSLGVR